MSTRSRLDSIEKQAGPDLANVPMAPARITLPGDKPGKLVPTGPDPEKRLIIQKTDPRNTTNR